MIKAEISSSTLSKLQCWSTENKDKSFYNCRRRSEFDGRRLISKRRSIVLDRTDRYAWKTIVDRCSHRTRCSHSPRRMHVRSETTADQRTRVAKNPSTEAKQNATPRMLCTLMYALYAMFTVSARSHRTRYVRYVRYLLLSHTECLCSSCRRVRCLGKMIIVNI